MFLGLKKKKGKTYRNKIPTPASELSANSSSGAAVWAACTEQSICTCDDLLNARQWDVVFTKEEVSEVEFLKHKVMFTLILSPRTHDGHTSPNFPSDPGAVTAGGSRQTNAPAAASGRL